MEDEYSLNKIEEPIGYLVHEPTHTHIADFTKIGWFKRTMIKWCFGLEYINVKNK